jgi:hypothetical protein
MQIRAAACACLSFFLLLSAAPSVHAFDYNEHKYLSNVGFLIALEASRDRCLPEDDLLKLVSRDAIEKGYSFGDIVGLGDYIHDVEAILEKNGESDPRQDSYQAFAWQHVPELKRDRLRFLQAAHVNESHFQQGALMAHLNHHDSAILMARSGRLFRALVLEAYGLHFLEDFHAPGHVATTRFALPDYVAIAVHEKYNSAGLDFRIRDGKNQELADLIAVAAGLDFQALAHKGMPSALILDAKDFEALKSALDGPPQRFVGDSLLGGNKLQAAYLALLSARSMLDVLDAARGDAAARNSFVPVCWYFGFCAGNLTCDGQPIPKTVGPLKRARTPFGEYEGSRHRLLSSVFKPGDVLMLSYYNEFSNSSGIEGRAGSSEIAIESLLTSSVPLRFVNLGECRQQQMERMVQRFSWFAMSVL